MNRRHNPQLSADNSVTSYHTDLEYLDDLMAWVEARCRRIRQDQRNENLRDGFDEADDCDDDWDEEYRSDDGRAKHERSRRVARAGSEALFQARIAERVARSNAEGRTPAFERLAEGLELDGFERMVLIIAIGTSLSRQLLGLVGQLEGTSFGPAVSVESLFVFAELDFEERVRRRRTFSQRGRLLANDLVTVDSGARLRAPGDLLEAVVEATNRSVGIAVGDEALDDELLEFSSVTEPMASFDSVVLNDADRRRVLSVVERHELYLQRRAEWGFDDLIRYGRGIWLLFHGKPGTGKTMTAHAVADRLGKRILAVDIPTFVGSHEAERFLPALFREARIQNAILFFDECEVLFASRHHGNMLMSLLLSELERFEGVAIMATNLPENLDEALMRRILVKVRFPEPDVSAREQIWRAHIPAEAPLADDVDIGALAERFPMAGGYIKNAVLAALADAVHGTDEGAGPIAMTHLERAAAEQLEGITVEAPAKKAGFSSRARR